MRPADVTTFLAKAIPARQPILLTGAPGVGKSDLVAQAAQQAKADIILSHPVVSDPTDAKGLPWITEDRMSATFLPFGELCDAINATRLTVWFLDDLGQASPAVQASFMQLLLARRVNGHILPDCITFVAATNRRTDRAGVQGILEPVKSRFASIIPVDVDLEDWTNWAIDNAIPAEVIAFLRFRPELLHQFNPTADLTNSPCPRTWVNAAKLLALQLPMSIELSAIAGAIGEGPAGEFVSFLRMFRELPNLDAILLDPMSAQIPDSPSTLYAVCTGLATKATATNFARIVQYCDRLYRANHAEFAALLLRDCVRRDSKVCNTSAFQKLTASPLGKLMLGEK